MRSCWPSTGSSTRRGAAGIGVASALARAQALGDPLRCGVVIEDAKLIVSAHHACSPDEALARLVFVSKHTNGRLLDVAMTSSRAPPVRVSTGSRHHRCTG